jgi:transcription elongation factor Elf1
MLHEEVPGFTKGEIMTILSCPHCGGSSYLHANYSHKIKNGGYFVFVKCDICGAQGKAYTCVQDPVADEWDNQACRDAVAAWNMRTGGQDYGY